MVEPSMMNGITSEPISIQVHVFEFLYGKVLFGLLISRERRFDKRYFRNFQMNLPM